jgi:hypothetical protein
MQAIASEVGVGQDIGGELGTKHLSRHVTVDLYVASRTNVPFIATSESPAVVVKIVDRRYVAASGTGR